MKSPIDEILESVDREVDSPMGALRAYHKVCAIVRKLEEQRNEWTLISGCSDTVINALIQSNNEALLKIARGES